MLNLTFGAKLVNQPRSPLYDCVIATNMSTIGFLLGLLMAFTAGETDVIEFVYTPVTDLPIKSSARQVSGAVTLYLHPTVQLRIINYDVLGNLYVSCDVV